MKRLCGMEKSCNVISIGMSIGILSHADSLYVNRLLKIRDHFLITKMVDSENMCILLLESLCNDSFITVLAFIVL